MTHSRSCPVCNASIDQSKLFLEENIDPSRLSSYSFASRKEPEYMCHRLMQCTVCDVVYVSEPPGQDELAHAYHVAAYDSSEEANDAASAYLRAIQPVLAQLPQRQSALEIGTGTGIFLEHLKSSGFSELVGVEPSSAAIAAAPEERKPWIREGIFSEANFAPQSFDLICCFMTMEHVATPGELARSALRLLRPGGAFVTITHDYRSRVNRILGKKSPIIDVEHMQIFSARSIGELFKRSGYANISVREFSNTYSVRYWTRLAPLPNGIKHAATGFVTRTGLDRLKLTFNVGNSIAAGFRRL